jgi:hypothetical protein
MFVARISVAIMKNAMDRISVVISFRADRSFNDDSPFAIVI